MAPPNATATSPPLDRIALMSLTIRDSFSGMLPPQVGTQPADEPMTKAAV